MATESRMEVKVGALIVFCAVLFVGFLIVLGDFRFGEESAIEVDWETTAGLKTGAQVKVAGMPAGRVEEIRYLTGENAIDTRGPFVRVRVSIEPQLRETLRKDARFYISTIGLLGEKYVEVDPGTEAEKLSDDVQPGMPPMRIEVMSARLNLLVERMAKILEQNEETLSAALKDVRAITKSGRKAVDEGRAFIAEARSALEHTRKKLDEVAEKGSTTLELAQVSLKEYTPGSGETGDHVKKLVRDGSRAVGTLDRAIGDGAELAAMVSDARSLTRTARDVVENVGAKATRLATKAEKLVDTADETLQVGRAEITTALAKARSILGDVQSVIKALRDGHGTVGALLNDREMYDDAREMMKDLKRHPWKFLWKE